MTNVVKNDNLSREQEHETNLRGNAYRTVYAVSIGEDIWVIHAFQKKSKTGIRTAGHEIELVGDRLRRLKEMLR